MWALCHTKMQWNNIFNVIVASWYQQKMLISALTIWIAQRTLDAKHVVSVKW